MKKSEINFALIGCGRISKKYFEFFGSKRNNHAKLIAVCDIDESRAKNAGKILYLPYYVDMIEMMETEKNIDVVVILTPSGLHAIHAIRLAKFKKHLIVEKPMALTIIDAKKMISVAKRNKIKLFVVKQNRFNRPIQELRKVFENKKLGKIFYGSARIRWSRDQNYYDQDSWRGTYALDGGVFANQSVHYIDLLQWFLGEPISVFARGQRSFAKIETEDTGVAIIQFKNNILATIEATVATRPRDLEGSLSILGDLGSVEIAGLALNEIRVWDVKNYDGRINSFSSKPQNVYGSGHESYLSHVIDVLQNDKKPLVDGEEGLRTVKILAAIYESMASNKEIFLNKKFNPQNSKLGEIND